MTDEGMAVEGFGSGVYEDENDVVFDGASGAKRIDENEISFFVVLKSVFCGILKGPIGWANIDFSVAFDFFAEEFRGHEVPTNCDPDEAEAGFDDGWFGAFFEDGAFGMKKVNFAIASENFSFAIDVVGGVVILAFDFFDAGTGNDVDAVFDRHLAEDFEIFSGFARGFVEVDIGTTRVVAESVFWEDDEAGAFFGSLASKLLCRANIVFNIWMINIQLR